MMPTMPMSHRRSRSDILSYNQDEAPSDREAILRVGFITSPSVSVSPVSQRPGRRYSKELPLRPSVSSGLTSPRNLVDKKLPPIPRRPVGRSRSLDGRAEGLPALRRSRTTSDIKTNEHVWSLFPRTTEPQSVNSRRPMTSPRHVPEPKKWSFEESPALDRGTLPGSPPVAQKDPVDDLRVRARQLMGARDPPPVSLPQPTQEVVSPQRHLRLKRSIARLTNLSKKPEGAGHERKVSDGGSRLRSLFRRPSKLLRVGESGNTTSEFGVANAVAIRSIPESGPGPIVAQPPLSPVGIYDPVTKMWLTPQTSPTRTQFGVFDPESRVWMAPGPRSDSLQKVTTIDANTTASSNPRDSSASDISYELEEGALSLAEKLEMIRYKPLSRTISSLDTSMEPLTKEIMPSLKRTNSGESISTFHTAQVQDRPRPWKPGQLLGLKAPPKDNRPDGTPLDDEDLEDLDFRPSFSMHQNNSIDGSGYMSLDTEQEEAKAPWKSLMKNVPQMLRKASNLRRD